MFVQVIKGKVSDPAAVRGAFDRWVRDLSPGATGWLGSTSGVTDDGTMITLARFDTEEHARRNSDRAEQGQWWAETEQLFDGDVTFADSVDVDTDLVADPDTAGFVQVMQGEVSDPDRARELMRAEPNDRSARPDILGTVSVGHDGGRWTMAAYFTSESDARRAEAQPPPPEMAALMEELQGMTVGEVSYYDLRDPWLVSAPTAG